eukprot:m.17944 g.17944  ORF g.17944 m.17944 type:complete len:327 (+) comp27572_c0_seq1:78-1058(+)
MTSKRSTLLYLLFIHALFYAIAGAGDSDSGSGQELSSDKTPGPSDDLLGAREINSSSAPTPASKRIQGENGTIGYALEAATLPALGDTGGDTTEGSGPLFESSSGDADSTSTAQEKPLRPTQSENPFKTTDDASGSGALSTPTSGHSEDSDEIKPTPSTQEKPLTSLVRPLPPSLPPHRIGQGSGDSSSGNTDPNRLFSGSSSGSGSGSDHIDDLEHENNESFLNNLVKLGTKQNESSEKSTGETWVLVLTSCLGAVALGLIVAAVLWICSAKGRKRQATLDVTRIERTEGPRYENAYFGVTSPTTAQPEEDEPLKEAATALPPPE